MPPSPRREHRIHDPVHPDQRDPFQRDRDRVLYCSAFRRLAGVTQVVGADEGHLFHNRLTHSMKVAQIARRIAEWVATQAAERGVPIDDASADVAETAALAHDLGHPPFGHAGEDALDHAVKAIVGEHGDGYEGNAQSFRILTKLALRHHGINGLDLTRASLCAVLKYPWLRTPTGKRSKKYGAYESERDEFLFAHAGLSDGLRSLEADIMDWADDFAYAVHDVEDFYRCGLVPLSDFHNESLLKRFLSETRRHWCADGFDMDEALAIANGLGEYIPPELTRPYIGDSEQRRYLRGFTSTLIGRYVTSVKVKDEHGEPVVSLTKNAEREVKLLKQVMRYYVYGSPALVAQQIGQRRVVTELFEDIYEATGSSHLRRFLPISFREQLEGTSGGSDSRARISADVIASMTEQQAYAMHARLRGVGPGSVRDGILG
jgi:dGTPase